MGVFTTIKDKVKNVAGKVSMWVKGAANKTKEVVVKTVKAVPKAIDSVVTFGTQQLTKVAKAQGEVIKSVVGGVTGGIGTPVLLGGIALAAVVLSRRV